MPPRRPEIDLNVARVTAIAVNSPHAIGEVRN